ncbi:MULTISPECIES: lysophospholipid acyltransferase family protein [unclassified Mesorhizobium]|uniref:lysophospholipid acyltransferase family protein n=1 Tax=unclassified Mesorhizobium TaxID=325217 RepID=UPI000FE2FE2E|nr:MULTISPECIES: lysophospholipid acyltransferase family protein [unclassified Mesorhizobium]MDG4891990.1 lysophospholipid acyltransferase family protein [Mesorhizobium sp. WSM4976]RWH71892.1 MAG: 1-acyl-sn-glycerol-3-phosphate acyltransferase [Mesorhizobium sp.]RWL32899.1 MAG: 1-acyl-sn-glycerol-3-phosphate acyltransferase [Mesorhizobium sp.]RWL33907.1 MAG: 1-acyl-sn-glycerol-3-phosphate acyltransferase [Mesorhizobium sp.]RWL40000.1 MAG: 1-acyl-sn-glycerol-3-phosphate acyltransferase [Mesorhi
MIEKLRIFLALFYVVVCSLVLVPLQILSMRTGLWPETVILKIWHSMVLRALGMRVHVTGSLAKDRPLLVAANHISWTDIMVLGSFADVKFIARADMEGWPLIGMLSKLQRTVFIERERKRTSGDQASEIAKRMAKGDAMVLFAEGSTGDGNLVLPFKSTLFGAASIAISEGAAEQVFIQPVAIAYTRLHGMPMGRRHRPITAWIGDQDLMPHLKTLLAEGAIDAEVHFGEPVPFSKGSSRKETARLMEAKVREMMQGILADPAKSR